MIRRIFAFALLCSIFSLWGEQITFAALSENDIEDAVDEATVPPFNEDAACGGLLHVSDIRALAYYSREREALDCRPTFLCEKYNPTTGKCDGEGCEIVRREGLPDTTIVHTCSSGSCNPKSPRTSCSSGLENATYREYTCKNATAKCYSYEFDTSYDFTLLPFTYNCIIEYGSSPVLQEDPTGFPDLLSRYELPSFTRSGIDRLEPAPESNVTVPSGPIGTYPRDSSMESLALDRGAAATIQAVMHPTFTTPFNLEDYPPLLQTIGRLLQPPEVRLVLPSGGLSLQHARSTLFSRIFSSLQSSRAPEPVEELLGDTPDALLLAARYLREIPLLEVTYVPVEVLVPSISSVEITQRIAEWDAWLAGATQMATAQNVTIDPVLLQRIAENKEVMQSYIALQESVRRYRLHFPSYINALLSYVERTNTFFRDSWVEENAKRLEAWHAAYMQELPKIRDNVQALYAKAVEVTADCLVPACRMNVIPVKSGTKPLQLFPPSPTGGILDPEDRAYLPEGPPLWVDPAPPEGKGQYDRRVQWHPLMALGSPLPDLTFDFSELKVGRPIQVPVLSIESHHLELPIPPALDPVSFQEDLTELTQSVQPLARLHPPLFALTFPELTLPDPTTSLLLVPEPPTMLPEWSKLLQWREGRLDALHAVCDSSATPENFLVSEPDLYGSLRDPAAVRAVTFVAGTRNQGNILFPLPTTAWSSAFARGGTSAFAPWGFAETSLVSPFFCLDCASIRPQRMIRQHIELDVEWENLQQTLFMAMDTWNAIVRFRSIVPRSELTREDRDRAPHSGVPESFLDTSP